MEHEAPNLDGMTPEDLNDWITKESGWPKSNPRKEAKKIFGTASNGRTKALAELIGYAWNKYTAMSCRLRGDIQAALVYERICDRIYGELPEFAKW